MNNIPTFQNPANLAAFRECLQELQPGDVDAAIKQLGKVVDNGSVSESNWKIYQTAFRQYQRSIYRNNIEYLSNYVVKQQKVTGTYKYEHPLKEAFKNIF